MKTILRILIVFLSIGVGSYALSYLDFNVQGILNSKPIALLQNYAYRAAFYTHVVLGATALAVGPFQFFPKWRNRNLSLHRIIGKVYVIACLLGGLAGLIIAMFATGGIVAKLGFSGLAIAWLYTTSLAYLRIRQRDVDAHYRWMVRSFALTFAAVTLRLYLPLSDIVLNLDFISAYRVISWACWVPNLLLAEFIILRSFKKKAQMAS
jgi:uncharacterized membrane protein